MTDFTAARTVKCHLCGTWFCDAEGMLCDCMEDSTWCPECGEALKCDSIRRYCDNCHWKE
jgi:hypothetical protein